MIMYYFEPHEVERIIDATPRGRQRLFVAFLYGTGMRVAEAMAVEGKDLALHMNPPRVVVMNPKGGTTPEKKKALIRAVPLHPELVAMLDATEYDDKERLFNWTYMTSLRIVQRAIAKAGVKGFTLFKPPYKPGCHSLRHSAARAWHAQGVGWPQISVWLGHGSLEITVNTYQPKSKEDIGSMDKLQWPGR